MVTAKGGRVLDPFGGSGSTAWAAWREGRSCDLIEKYAPYTDHIAAGIDTLGAPETPRDAAAAPQSDLFGA